ncbi:MAG: hypothetical protein JRD89_12645 [Deltaproteobacteria bacterium]|nr:hypothetical protein [Deltaproteobacteria bacterium]MBW2674241.1 hypothetical protein [Deltaproteobacteria bacterium]
MKELIQAIQTALRNAAELSYITDANIFITPDENLLPIGAGYPAIGLKDGLINFLIEEGADWESNYAVDIIIYQLLKTGDISVTGQTSPKVYGVLEIADDIHSVLFDNRFSISGMEVALPSGEGSAEWMESSDISIVKKRITYQYKKLEVNP